MVSAYENSPKKQGKQWVGDISTVLMSGLCDFLPTAASSPPQTVGSSWLCWYWRPTPPAPAQHRVSLATVHLNDWVWGLDQKDLIIIYKLSRTNQRPSPWWFWCLSCGCSTVRHVERRKSLCITWEDKHQHTLEVIHRDWLKRIWLKIKYTFEVLL